MPTKRTPKIPPVQAPEPAPAPHQDFDPAEPFPVDHNLWTILWNRWRMANDERLLPLQGRNPFRAKNPMAEDVLGVWTIDGHPTELSAVLMPGEIRPDIQVIRYVGITRPDYDANIVGSFTELETKLWPSADDAPSEPNNG